MPSMIDSDAAYIPAINFTDAPAVPAAPMSGHHKIYFRDGSFRILDSSGFEDTSSAIVSLTTDRLAVGGALNALTALTPGATGAVPTRQADGTIAEIVPSGASAATFVGARLRANATQAFTAGQSNFITFQVEDFDTDAFHSTSTNPTRITVPTGKAGYYTIGGSFNSASQGSILVALLFVNHTVDIARSALDASGSLRDYNLSTVYHLAEGDYVELAAYPVASGLSSAVIDLASPCLWVARIGA